MFQKTLLVAAVLAASVLNPSTIDASYTPVIAGTTMKVTVTAAECSPLNVVLSINGKEVTGTITTVPGSVNLDVSAGTTSESYDLDVTCGTDRFHDSGTVQ